MDRNKKTEEENKNRADFFFALSASLPSVFLYFAGLGMRDGGVYRMRRNIG